MSVTARDRELLVLVSRMRFMTIEHADTCVYDNRNVAQRRLASLASDELLRSYASPSGRKGHPTKVYYPNPKERHKIAGITGESYDEHHGRSGPPENITAARHALEVNDVLAAMIAGAKARNYSFSFMTEHLPSSSGRRFAGALEDEVQDPANPRLSVRYQRDAVCCIGTDRGKALFEIEYDRGKEAVDSDSRRKVTIRRKIEVFLQSLKERRFERYSTPAFFNHPFKTSRMLLITTSAERVSNIASVCHQLDTHGLVYLTTMDQILPETVLGSIWVVPECGQAPVKALVGQP